MKRCNLHLLTAALLTVLAVACTPGGGSIYFTLENEVKVDDATLPNEITVFDVANTGTDYYAAAGRIWTAPVTAANFQVADVVTPPHADDLCTALAFFSGELYGGFINGSGNRGLYATTALAFTTTPVADTDIAGAQIALLKEENSLLVAVAARPSGLAFEHFVYTSPDGAAYTELEFNGLPNPRASGEELKPINDVIYAGAPFASPSWFATEGTNLYSGGGPLSRVATTGITAGEELRGLFQLGSRLFLSSKAGAVYYSDDGVAWTRIEAPKISGAHPPLTRFAGPVGAGILLLGSDGYGYYRIDSTDLAAGTASITRFPTTTIDLYSASVTKFTLDTTPDPDVMFAATAMGGLWRGTVAVDGTIAWELE
jgi:hypothetical protein